MPVYRGPGGAGDATNDATVTAVQSAATSAATSATAAANSATAAANSATGAATSATNAANSATTAAGQATTAAGHATNASTFATNSSLSATDSADSATEAEGYASEAFDYKVEASVSAGAASDSADAAAASAALAEGAVDDALALYGDAAALDAAVTAAQLAETNAETAETNAETAATTATNAAATATTQASNAAASAVAADADATAASLDANEAQAAATAAQAAVNSATAIYGSIEDIQQAEANSEANRDAAAASATSASNSASTATTQAGIATTQATNAATSAAQASAVALGNEPVRHSVRPSLLLDFANTKTLDPRITYTRASAGTYYDGKTVALAEQNLLIQSQFATSWGRDGRVTITTNASVAPDGTTTAALLTCNTSLVSYAITQTAANTVGSTFSVYAKAGTSNIICISTTGSNIALYANFNVSTGALGKFSNCTPSIVSVGNGWYRCTMANTLISGGTGVVYISVADADLAVNHLNCTWTAGGTMNVWGAQLEQRSTVTAYTATTTAPITNYVPVLLSAPANVARFEHNPVTGESLGLEIEEQRTNLLLQSEDFDSASWTKVASSIVSNTVISPNGTLTGDKLVENTANNLHKVNFTATVANGVVCTLSIYAKAAGRNWVAIQLANGFANNPSASFDLSTGTIGTQVGSPSATITSVGNGWYRCSITATSNGSASNIDVFTASANATVIYTGNGFDGVYIWGAQLEAGAFATSYIPTTVSQVTRSADSASMTGTNFSSWYRADEGSVYIDSVVNTGIAGAYPLYINDTTGNNYIRLTAAASAISYQVGAAGTNNVNITNSGLTNNAVYKGAFVYKTNDCAVSFNGGTVSTDTSNTIPVVNTLSIGTFSGVTATTTIKKIAYYPKRLTNAELQSLTVI